MNSKDLATKEFRRYSLKHETITYAIMPPLAVYFAIIIGNYTGSKLYFALFVGFGLFAAPMSCFVSVLIRSFLLKPLLINYFNSKNLNTEELTRLKSDLLRYPYSEGIINILRWIAGPLFFLIGNSFGMNLDVVNIITPLMIIIYMSPLAFISGFVLAEMDLSKFLESENFISIPISKERAGSFPQIYRFFFSLFAVSWIPLIVLSYVILLIHNGILNFPNLNIHLPILVILFLTNTIIYTFILSKPIDMHLKTISKGITSLSNGQIILIPVFSNDEFGKLNDHFNSLNNVLRKSFEKINIQSVELLADSQRMKEYSEILSKSSETQTLNTKQLSDLSSEMDQVSNTISDSSTNQTIQTKESEEVIFAMEDSIEKISLSMIDASNISGKTFLLSEEGFSVVNTALAQIQKIQENTKSISGIIELISDISDQINLLSLNASIEAARAGEAGKGFNVVASEVSKLAEHTQKNVKEIAKSIKEAVKSANAGYETINNTSHKFEDIQKNIKITVGKINEISENVKGQKKLGQRVEESFSVISQLSIKINGEIETERIFSEKLTRSVSEIKDSTQLSRQTIHNLERIAATLADRSKFLTNQIQFFKYS